MRVFALLLAAGLVLAAVPGPAQDKAAPAPAAQPGASFRPTEISFSGKLYSPVKLSVFLPYNAKITALSGHIGQKVKRNEVLGTYEIPLETRMDEKTKLSPANIKELEHKLANADKEIDRFSAKARELEAMSQRSMASQQSIAMNSKEIEVFRKEKVAVSEQLALARDLLNDRVELAEDRFGKGAGVGKMPKDGIIKAPIDGFVMWMNPELRNGVKLAKEAELFQVGSLDPMIIRAQVHEIEAQKLKEGMAATVTFDSIPGKKYAASVSRIPWAPMPAALQQPSYYEIELTIPNPNQELKEGLKGQIVIQPEK
ncbi:MAG: efflux RND transporter periplasmic adaptor subunit [Solidesulfovibrio sp.]|uniref:efflux RND transporter periplasmic adaptor subunit n=1 Tax=Solidesulfovibrio sp. TaxID=2910990 RepID=UPI002B1EAC2A|nr:efflux RND transporter periplasmic adaptor subunit [Solidesulfovibrio sp.]MEA4858348.1 efflux RND transporter periplasmic adaptor subunit [Solidesulfovibrio sp.]